MVQKAVKLFQDGHVTIAKTARSVNLVVDTHDDVDMLFNWLEHLGSKNSTEERCIDILSKIEGESAFTGLPDSLQDEIYNVLYND